MNNRAGYRHALQRYRLGLLLAVLLTTASAALALWPRQASNMALAVLLTLALVQVWVHLHFFLHIGAQRRDETRLVALSALIILLMVGGSLLVFFDQMQRM